MGYCMNQSDTVFLMNRKNSLKALEAIKRLDQGAWVSAEFASAKTFKSVMDDWRWEVDEDEQGCIIDIHFRGEKLGDDHALFNAIAPFVDEGSYIEMLGDDGAHWKWAFNGKVCKELTGHIVYDE